MEAYQQGKIKSLPKIIGGRYGFSSKEFTAMVKAVYDELKKDNQRMGSLSVLTTMLPSPASTYDESFKLDESEWRQGLFFGLGADGTVGAKKNTIKIIGKTPTCLHRVTLCTTQKNQAPDTVSHLVLAQTDTCTLSYFKADFIACHQFNFVEKVEMLEF